MGVVSQIDHFPVIYCEALRTIEIFAKYVKTRFKNLIFNKYQGKKKKAIREREFLGAKMLDSVREIAENWVTFVSILRV